VTGDTHNELQSDTFSQWAEPLETNFARVLAENLSVLLTTERVAVYPWQGPERHATVSRLGGGSTRRWQQP
jgi:hypothetical protein